MTVTGWITILDDKIKTNQAQYDLIKEAAKISALPSYNLLDIEYEYLTGEGIGHKPCVFENPLRMSLSKAFKEREGRRKLFYCLSKNVCHHGWPSTNN